MANSFKASIAKLNDNDRKSATPIQEKAPELLIEKIAWLNGVISKHKIKNPSGKGLEDYEDLLQVMRYMYNYVLETKRMHYDNSQLRAMLQIMAEQNNRMQKRIEEFDALVRMDVEGRLDDEIMKARAYTRQIHNQD